MLWIPCCVIDISAPNGANPLVLPTGLDDVSYSLWSAAVGQKKN